MGTIAPITPSRSMKVALGLVLFLALSPAASAAEAMDTERRLEAYRCTLRLPGADFSWLSAEDLPGATAACRDSKGRFVILLVRQAPPGYFLDARQAAGFEQGMRNKSDGIERLGGEFTEFLGVPAYDLRGRMRADQSLTLTRMFVANGFLYDLQAMIPPPVGAETGRFDDLMASFRFIGSPEIPRPARVSGMPSGATGSEAAATSAPVPASGAAPPDGVGKSVSAGAIPGPAAEPARETDVLVRLAQLLGGSLLVAIMLVFLMRRFGGRRTKR